MKRFVCSIFLFALILSGCKKEPMIRLSEERQAALSAIEVTEVPPELASVDTVVLDTSQFKVYDETMVFEDLSAFVPIQPNQLNRFNENNVEFIQYMDFVDSNFQIMQVREVFGDKQTNTFYAWGSEQIVQLASEQAESLPINRIAQIANEVSERLVLLQAPLQKGTQWMVDDHLKATITNLFKEIELNGIVINDVIEVTYESQESQTQYYFAKGFGIVAIIYPQGQKILMDTQIDVQFQTMIPVYVPSIENHRVQLIRENTDFAWQTNDQLAKRYTSLFQSLGWITTAIQINSIQLNNDTLIVDFTPGVVAAINAHPTREEGIIPAIVATLGQHFDVNQVQLMVGGLGLSPDRLSYPVGGIWIVRDEWLVKEDRVELTENGQIFEETTIQE